MIASEALEIIKRKKGCAEKRWACDNKCRECEYAVSNESMVAAYAKCIQVLNKESYIDFLRGIA